MIYRHVVHVAHTIEQRLSAYWSGCSPFAVGLDRHWFAQLVPISKKTDLLSPMPIGWILWALLKRGIENYRTANLNRCESAWLSCSLQAKCQTDVYAKIRPRQLQYQVQSRLICWRIWRSWTLTRLWCFPAYASTSKRIEREGIYIFVGSGPWKQKPRCSSFGTASHQGVID